MSASPHIGWRVRFANGFGAKRDEGFESLCGRPLPYMNWTNPHYMLAILAEQRAETTLNRCQHCLLIFEGLRANLLGNAHLQDWCALLMYVKAPGRGKKRAARKVARRELVIAMLQQLQAGALATEHDHG